MTTDYIAAVKSLLATDDRPHSIAVDDLITSVLAECSDTYIAVRVISIVSKRRIGDISMIVLASRSLEGGRRDLALVLSDKITTANYDKYGMVVAISREAEIAGVDVSVRRICAISKLRRVGLDASITAVSDSGGSAEMIRGLLLAFDITPIDLVAVVPEHMRTTCLELM